MDKDKDGNAGGNKYGDGEDFKDGNAGGNVDVDKDEDENGDGDVDKDNGKVKLDCGNACGYNNRGGGVNQLLVFPRHITIGYPSALQPTVFASSFLSVSVSTFTLSWSWSVVFLRR